MLHVSPALVEISAAPLFLAALRARDDRLAERAHCIPLADLAEISPTVIGLPDLSPFKPGEHACHYQIASFRSRAEAGSFLAGMPFALPVRVFLATDAQKQPVFAMTMGYGSRENAGLLLEGLSDFLPQIGAHSPRCTQLFRSGTSVFPRETNWRRFPPHLTDARWPDPQARVSAQAPAVLLSAPDARGGKTNHELTSGARLIVLGKEGDYSRVLTEFGHTGWLRNSDIRF